MTLKVNGENLSSGILFFLFLFLFCFFTVIAKPPFHVQPVLSFGKKGIADGMFQNPEGMAVSERDEIILADTFNHRVQVFDSNFLIVTF